MAPYQTVLANEIAARREADAWDPHIAGASDHVGALFVGMNPKKGMQVRTLSLFKLNMDLKELCIRLRPRPRLIIAPVPAEVRQLRSPQPVR